LSLVDVKEDFFKVLHPKLTVLIAAYSKDKRPNVMACSWITPASEEPPLIAAFLARTSYTRQLILESKYFTVNVPTLDLLKAVWVAGTRSGRRGDKIKAMGVAVKPAKNVDAPIIDGCAAYLECKLNQAIEVGECTALIGEVVEAYANPQLFQAGAWSVERAKLLLHLGGALFTLPSGTVKAK